MTSSGRGVLRRVLRRTREHRAPAAPTPNRQPRPRRIRGLRTGSVPKHRRSARVPTLLTVSTVLAALAACTGADPTPSPHRSPSTSPSTSPSPSSEPAVGFGRTPVWQREVGRGAPADEDFTLENIEAARIVDDLLIYSGVGRAGGDDLLVAADAASGQVRWALREDQPLGKGGVHLNATLMRPSELTPAGPASARLLLVEYNDGDGGGIAALSAKTGKLRWTLPVVSDTVRGDTFEFVRVGAADTQRFVLNVEVGTAEQTLRERTMAFDLSDRHQLWEREGVTAGMAGDTVFVGHHALPYRDGADDPDPDSTLLPLHATTGQTAWRLTEPGRAPDFWAGTPDAAVLETGDGTRVVDPATGKTRGTNPKAPTSCARGAGARIACVTVDSVLLVRSDGLRAVDKRLSSDVDDDEHWIEAVDGGLLIRDDNGNATVLDAAGQRTAARLPGLLLAAAGRHAVFTSAGSSSSRTQLSGYRIRHR